MVLFYYDKICNGEMSPLIIYTYHRSEIAECDQNDEHYLLSWNCKEAKIIWFK